MEIPDFKLETRRFFGLPFMLRCLKRPCHQTIKTLPQEMEFFHTAAEGFTPGTQVYVSAHKSKSMTGCGCTLVIAQNLSRIHKIAAITLEAPTTSVIVICVEISGIPPVWH